MIRVLHYIGMLEYGGSQAFILEIYRNINHKKIQFDFVVFPNGNAELKREIKRLGARIYVSPQYNGRNHFLYQKWWNDFLKSHPEYQILHGHVRSVAAIYIPVAKKYGLKTIVHSHSTSNGTGFKAAVKNLMQLPVRFQADYFIACSPEAGKWLFGRKICSSNRYCCLANSIDVQRFIFHPKVREEVRRELHLSEKKVIGHAGRLEEPKNQKFLLDMMQQIRDDDVRLLIVGSGSMADALKRKAQQLQIEDRVIFTGARKDIERMYQAMDVFVFPSLWEGMPVSVIEAQAGGLRCLISDRITDEVKLTKRLCSLPLEKGTKYWAAQTLKALKYKRSGAQNAEIELLKKYDSSYTADRLQDVYACCEKDMDILEEKK